MPLWQGPCLPGDLPSETPGWPSVLPGLCTLWEKRHGWCRGVQSGGMVMRSYSWVKPDAGPVSSMAVCLDFLEEVMVPRPGTIVRKLAGSTARSFWQFCACCLEGLNYGTYGPKRMSLSAFTLGLDTKSEGWRGVHSILFFTREGSWAELGEMLVVLVGARAESSVKHKYFQSVGCS